MPGFDCNRNSSSISARGISASRDSNLAGELVSLPSPSSISQNTARRVKVFLDVLATLLLLVMFLPIFLIISAIVALDGGPVIYGHVRIGAEGRSFRCLKFRSMVVDSNAALQRLLDTDPAAAKEWAETHKLRRDPRITKFGKLLRKTSLDELPQLINVMRLEMSLVGPRPIVKEEIVKYGKYIEFYYKVKPGITGLWQVSGRSKTSYTERVALDVRYVEEWSILQDILITIQTVPAILRPHETA